MGILQLLGFGGKVASGGQSASVQRLVAELDNIGEKNPRTAKYLAAFAYLLSRVANADGEISPEEVELMQVILHARAGLSREHAEMVVSLAAGENLSHGGEDDRLVSGVFADVTNHETRVQLVDALFAVASADQVIYRSEAAAIRAIAREVGLKKDDLDQINAGYEHFIQS